MTRLKIRHMTSADLPAAESLRAQTGHPESSADWQCALELSPTGCLVAESEGRLLGLTHYLFHRSTTAIAPNCYLQDLFTSAAARGKGVGRALIEGVYERARAAGSTRVYWQTHETNKAAMRLYDQVAKNGGFVVYSQAV